MLTTTHQPIGIGDPTISGWIIVFAYLFATWRCLIKSNQVNQSRKIDPFWIILAISLLFLGINKQLDLQTLFEVSMKNFIKTHGWYEQRRVLQMIFIIAFGLGMIAALTSLRFYIAKGWAFYKTVWAGMILLCVFIILRAASFNHLDSGDIQLGWGFNLYFLLEFGAILVIIAGTYTKK